MLQFQYYFLHYRLDFVVLVLVVVAGSFAWSRYLKQRKGNSRISRKAYVTAGVIILLGGIMAEWTAGDRVRYLERLFAGFGPTYATELSRAGHDKITFQTAADDPHYLQLIELEKRWLAMNPLIADIYTFRKNAKGEICFVVDSETDYNHNGKIDEEREQRTPIGETYDDATEYYRRALEGETIFDSHLVSDRWGVWVSSFAPIYSANGQVDAAVGIDYPAESWIAEISGIRTVSLGVALVLVVILLVSSGFIAALSAEIEQRKQTQLRLEQASESAFAASAAKSEFLALMSHEVRTPLTAIMGFANVLTDTALDPKQQRYVETINVAGKSLVDLLNHILDYTRAESGKLTLEKIPWAPALLVHEVMELMSARAGEKNLQLHFENRLPGSLTLAGDPVRVRQVVLNLVNNAVKFTAKGNVTVRAEWKPAATRTDAQGELMIQVTDTGVGIAPEKIPNLFSAFAQADSSTTRTHGGTGLGLAICKRLSDLMGAHITLQSTVKVGTNFVFRLPAECTAALKEDTAPADPTAPPQKLVQALVIDDTKLNRELLKVMLRRIGVEADLAASGPEGIALAANKTYQIIFTDLEMPGMDGFSAARQIRAQESRDQRVPIVAVSAMTASGTREKCFAAGMDDYLTKPVYLPALKSALTANLTKAAQSRPPAPTQPPMAVA